MLYLKIDFEEYSAKESTWRHLLHTHNGFSLLCQQMEHYFSICYQNAVILGLKASETSDL